MLTGLLKNRRNINRKDYSRSYFILFFIFLYFFNNIEKVELINRAGTSYEKAVVKK